MTCDFEDVDCDLGEPEDSDRIWTETVGWEVVAEPSDHTTNSSRCPMQGTHYRETPGKTGNLGGGGIPCREKSENLENIVKIRELYKNMSGK